MLWFDVETNNRTTQAHLKLYKVMLWFDVETNNRTTCCEKSFLRHGCGLMQKLIIEQRL